MILHLDFETRSVVDLPECGAYVYADDPSTKILCACYAVDDGPVQTLKYDDPAIEIEGSQFQDLLRDPSVLIVARNAEFERNIIRGVLGLDLPPSRFRCTAAQAARAGLSRHLETCCELLGVSEQKDSAGKRLITKLCRPRRPSKDNPDLFWEPHTAPEDFEALYAYCAQDVRADRASWKALPKLTDSEQAIWELTVKMNDRGVAVDLPAIPLAKAAAAAETERLSKRFYELTGVEPSQVAAAAEALGLPDLTKATVRKALKQPTRLSDPCGPQTGAEAAEVFFADDQPEWRREALEIRQKVAKSSLAKLDAFTNRTSKDGRIRGNLVYSGAERTARWSGYGVQPQNFPRGLGEDTDSAFDALHTGCFESFVRDTDSDVLGTVSNMLRGLFISKGGARA